MPTPRNPDGAIWVLPETKESADFNQNSLGPGYRFPELTGNAWGPADRGTEPERYIIITTGFN